MGLFTSHTIFGKIERKGTNIVSGTMKVISSPNPLKAASAALSGGTASASKAEAKQDKAQSRAMSSKSAPQTETSTTSGGFFKKNATILGWTLPLWIWIAILIAVILLLWWLLKTFVFKSKARGRTYYRRSTSSSSMKARMAKVRAAKRRKR